MRQHDVSGSTSLSTSPITILYWLIRSKIPSYLLTYVFVITDWTARACVYTLVYTSYSCLPPAQTNILNTCYNDTTTTLRTLPEKIYRLLLGTRSMPMLSLDGRGQNVFGPGGGGLLKSAGTLLLHPHTWKVSAGMHSSHGARATWRCAGFVQRQAWWWNTVDGMCRDLLFAINDLCVCARGFAVRFFFFLF